MASGLRRCRPTLAAPQLPGMHLSLQLSARTGRPGLGEERTYRRLELLLICHGFDGAVMIHRGAMLPE